MIPLPPGQQPRTWQLECRAALRAGLARWDSVLVEAATGVGKGTMIAALVASVARQGRRVLFLVHRDELLQDVAQRLRLVGVEAGLVGGGAKQVDRLVTCASVASCKPKLLAALQSHGRIEFVVTDEAHHAPAAGYQRVYRALREQGRVKHVGFTATPYRAGPEGSTSGLGRVFDALIYSYPIGRAIGDGVLVPVEGLRIATATLVSELEDEDTLEAEINTEPRNRLILEKYLEHGQGRPALGFALSIAHAQRLAEIFGEAGIRAEAVWGIDPQRAEKLAAYRAGELQVLFCRDLLTEGVDLPRVEVLLLTRPTGSPVLYAQMIGRGTRLAPGKTRCLALDFVDVLDHGAVQTLANLLDPGDPASARELLRPGSRVAHRHDPGRADGNIIEIVDGVIRMASVAWIGWGDVDRVPLGDLRRITLDVDGVAVEEQVVAPAIGGVAECRVSLFEGSALPWYRYQGTKGDIRYTLSAALTASQSGPRRVIQLVRERAGLWSAWIAGEDWPLCEGALADAVKAVAGWLCRVGLQPMDWSQPWTRLYITPAQEKGLRKWGLQRPLRSLSRGEAAILMDTKIAKAQIDAARKRRKVAA